MSQYNGPQREVPISERRDIIAAVLSPLSPQWEQGGDWGYVECPGVGAHSNSNGRRDCRVYAAERAGRNVMPPGVYCLHTSCKGVLDEVNHRIRSEIGKAKVRGMGGKPGSSPSGAPGSGPRTARTGDFKAPSKEGGDSRTVRTDTPKPLVRFARAQVRTQSPTDGASEPSVPSVVASIPPQPVAAGVPIAEQAPAQPQAVPVRAAPVQRVPPVKHTVPVNKAGGVAGDTGDITMVWADHCVKGYWVNGEWVTTKIL